MATLVKVIFTLDADRMQFLEPSYLYVHANTRVHAVSKAFVEIKGQLDKNINKIFVYLSYETKQQNSKKKNHRFASYELDIKDNQIVGYTRN